MAETEDQSTSAEPGPESAGSTPPSTKSKAFCCPHCGAYTHQYWYSVYPKRNDKNAVPKIPDESLLRKAARVSGVQTETHKQVIAKLKRDIEKHETGNVFLLDIGAIQIATLAKNLHLSECYTCGEIAVWVHTKLVYPPKRTGPPPNADLPKQINATYEEARSILDLSPRGAAALLRLCVENLCIHLDAKGSTLDNKIGDLVTKGLSVQVQQALDAVRVIGNEAVHPGQMVLEDDRGTAETLFRLVNVIAERMISEPKHVDAIFKSLPSSKLEAIERRDKKPEES